MKLGRVSTRQGRFLGRVEHDEFVPLVAEGERGDALRMALEAVLAVENLKPIGPALPLDACTVLAPVAAPSKIICIGLNYRDHAAESGMPIPLAPLCFAKTLNVLIGPNDLVSCPAELARAIDYEAEIAVIMGAPTRCVSPDEALDSVLGFTLCNDVTARDAQFGDGQWFRGKSFDTFLPLGPWVVTRADVDPSDIEFTCAVNDVVVQKGSTSNMIFDIASVVSYISQFLTLEPGDVIATGTPAGVGHSRTPPQYLADGDTIEVHSSAIGRLRNRVSIQPPDVLRGRQP